MAPAKGCPGLVLVGAELVDPPSCWSFSSVSAGLVEAVSDPDLVLSSESPPRWASALALGSDLDVSEAGCAASSASFCFFLGLVLTGRLAGLGGMKVGRSRFLVFILVALSMLWVRLSSNFFLSSSSFSSRFSVSSGDTACMLRQNCCRPLYSVPSYYRAREKHT